MNILVVDDNNLIRQLVSAVIVDAGHYPIQSEDADSAMKFLNNQDVDLILMDVEMPGMNGFELTRKIRSADNQDWIPIIFLSGRTDDKHLSEGIDAGGDDYLTKPVNPVILKAKIRAMERIAQMKSNLDSANRQLLLLTQIDPLTGAVNRRGMDETLDREWRRNNRERSELSVLMLDIDHFKLYNDNYGHQQGDQCLEQFAKLLKDQLKRSHDVAARFGGEEFVLILPNTPLEGAKVIAKEFLSRLEAEAIEHQYSSIANQVTCSIGISSTRFDPESPQALIEQADKALYQAKKQGRNRFIQYGDIV